MSGSPDGTEDALEEHSTAHQPMSLEGESPVYTSNHYVIYEATASDAVKLWYLSQITGQPRLRDRALIGDIQGAPAAAISLADNRIVADPSRDTTRLTRQLRSRAQSVRALERTPSVSARLREGVRIRSSSF
jgi:hypothetical protein